MKNTFTLICTFIVATAWAQQSPQLPIQPSKVDLKNLEVTFKKNYEIDRAKAEQIAKQFNIQLRQKSATGTIAEFSGFAANGQMLFNQTHNVGAGRTVSTNKVWPGGTTNTSLTGSGMTGRLGEWDGGAVLTTHQEFGGRVTQVDGATDIIEHATHVAGTLIAAGVDPNAKGMSYQAPLKAYDWNNDESEMTAAAAAGMLVSNHSYGSIAGWRWNDPNWEWWGDASVSQTEDYKFGFYDQQSAEWDDIASNNPFYLICKSAGNDRGDNISGGTTHLVRDVNFNWVTSNTVRAADGGTLGYDCVSSSATSKNILTVGAVQKINNGNNNNGYVNAAGVVMSSFSGWGPTDDGRIKPDVVGAGVNLYSTGPASNTAYLGNFSGTSMSSPNVAGSLLLVQQHYKNCKGVFMRSATLKGLAIHTADESGTSEGPDYKFGWGLLNTAKAVQLITDSNINQILQPTLANGTTYTQGLSSDGTQPLKVTICWTDKSGTPATISLDPTNLMLVNDLDLRITRNSDNTIFQPYILNPASPTSAATKGDNFRDNVEQVFIAAPTAGAYTVSVKHKGTLSGSIAQNFSIIIGGIVGKPSAAFAVDIKNICSGKSVTYTDNSGGNPTSRVWYFPGGTPSTSTAATVSITYPSIGKYPAALKVSNALGTDSVYQNNVVNVGGNILPFYETFESNSTTFNEWSVSNPDADVTWQTKAIGGTSPGNTSVYLNNYGNNNTGSRDGLASPVLNFAGFQNVSLSFKHAYTNYSPNETDSLIVYISTDCGNSWTRLRALGENGTNNFNTVPTSQSEFFPAISSDWCVSNCNTINLSAYDGLSNVRILFEGVSDYNNNLFIDNVSVTGTAVKPITKFGTTITTACVGAPVNFVDSTQNNPTAWQWTFTGANTVNVSTQHPSVVYNTPGVYTVKLKTTNPGGTDSLTKTNYVTVIQSPGIPNISAGGKIGFCIGDSVQLKTDSVGIAFMWYANNTLINGANTNLNYAKTTATYNVRILSNNGCGRTSADLDIAEGSKPTTPIVTSNLSTGAFCQGGTATLTSTAANGNQWYKNNIAINGAVNKTFASQDSGSFTVTSQNNGCLSNVSNSLALSIKSKPSTSVITGSIAANNNTVETYSVIPTSGSTYTWTISNGTFTNATLGNINVTWGTQATGNVQVKEIGSNGCFGDAQNLAITLTPNTGLAKIGFLQNISVYPNPVLDDVHILFSQHTQNSTTIKLINMLGQTVFTEQLTDIPSGYVYTIDGNKLNTGIYFVEINNTEGSKQIKLIKK